MYFWQLGSIPVDLLQPIKPCQSIHTFCARLVILWAVSGIDDSTPTLIFIF